MRPQFPNGYPDIGADTVAGAGQFGSNRLRIAHSSTTAQMEPDFARNAHVASWFRRSPRKFV